MEEEEKVKDALDCMAEFKDRIEALRHWRREEPGGLARALGKTDEYNPTNTSEVLRGKLYLGDIIASECPPPNVMYIISLGSGDREACRYRDIEGCVHHHFDIEDSSQADLFSILDKVTGLIHACLVKTEYAVFVHCVAGMSRSPAICMAYLIKYRDMTIDQAFSVVYCVRPMIWPNNGFIHQLKYFERKQQEKKNERPFF